MNGPLADMNLFTSTSKVSKNGQKMLEIATNWTYRSLSAVINEPAEYIVHFIHIKSVK